MRAIVSAVFLLLIASACSGVKPEAREVATEAKANRLLLTGRFAQIDDRLQFTWPGSSISFTFHGRAAKATLTTNERVRLSVAVDQDVRDLWLEPGTHTYQLVNADTAATRRVTLTRLTESFAIVTELSGLPVIDGTWQTPPAPRARKMLVLGDSISAGYGVEGKDQHCSYAKETSNQQLTYAALAAHALDADLHAIAWSGIGVWRSYGEATPVQPTLVVRSARALADDATSKWNAEQYQPQVLLINLGTNDFWQANAAQEYYQHLSDWLHKLRADYSNARVYLLASPMLSGENRAAQIDVLMRIAREQSVHFLDIGKIEAADGFGCDYHPNQITHTRMSETLVQKLRADLNW